MDSARSSMFYGSRADTEPDPDPGLPVSCDANVVEADQKDTVPQYTIQGVLHFLQTEWARLESQRADWEIDRAELKARIAFLEGERRGQENLKQDLVRRIKMLEYALKQERVKFHQYKASVSAGAPHGSKRGNDDATTAPSWGDETTKTTANLLDPGEKLALYTKQALETSSKWLESRSRLKKFLEEVGCTDNLLTVRQARVLQLLKSTPEWRGALTDAENKAPNRKYPSGKTDFSDEQLQSALNEMDQVIGNVDTTEPNTYTDEPAEPDTSGQPYEASEGVRVNRFRRTGGPHSSTSGKQRTSPGLDSEYDSSVATAVSSFISSMKSEQGADESSGLGDSSVDKNISGLMDALSDTSAGMAKSTKTDTDSSQRYPSESGTDSYNERVSQTDLSRDQVPGEGLVLGDLASLTVANEAEANTDSDLRDSNLPPKRNYDISSGSEATDTDSDARGDASRSPLALCHTLRGHLDQIRSLAFHPTDRAVFTASDDGCVMLWYLGKPIPPGQPGSAKPSGRGTSTVDELEPVHVYRGHNGPVLCVATPSQSISSNQSCVAYSGGVDGTIRGWYLPPVTGESGLVDLYSPFDFATTVGPVYRGSSAAVWSVSLHPSSPTLMAAHADGVVEFWSTDDAGSVNSEPLRSVDLKQLVASEMSAVPVGRPSCLQYLVNRPDSETAYQCVVGTTTGWLLLIDIQTGQLVSHYAPKCHTPLDTASDWNEFAFNGMAVHSTWSLIIGAHEDKQIRYYDIERMAATDSSTSEPSSVVDQMNAHTDAVTSVAIDPQGLQMLTGSHDASIRLWEIQGKVCIREFTNHRYKYNEAVHSVAFHPSLPLAASAGADGVCKVYSVGEGNSRIHYYFTP